MQALDGLAGLRDRCGLTDVTVQGNGRITEFGCKRDEALRVDVQQHHPVSIAHQVAADRHPQHTRRTAYDRQLFLVFAHAINPGAG